MMSTIWVVLFVALTGSHCGYGLPVRPTPQDYPHDEHTVFEGWGAEGGLYAAIPALALVVTAVVLIFGCTWCYQHKHCKPDEGTDNQIFTASAPHLHTARVHPPDSGFSEPANNNISEDNNNGPISLREMQNIANNNATAYIISENEERNRISRESVVEFEPLPTAIIGADPLEHCADWFGGEDFPRNDLQYLREIGRGWFGRVVEGEIEEAGASATVAVKILNQNASLEDKARFLDESRMYRDARHEHILAFIGKCLQEDPWILIFELCSMDLQQYLIVNRPKMAILNENGVPLRIMCDVTSALAYLHSRGYTYGQLWGGSVAVRGEGAAARALLGRYAASEPPQECFAPELQHRAALYTTNSEIWSLGTLIWEVCSWGSVPTGRPSPPPDLPCPYKSHLYQVMQLCWNLDPSVRPTAAQVHALVSHLHVTHTQARTHTHAHSDHADNADFEERWQRLKPNTIPKVDEHVAIVHAPSTSIASHFTGSEDLENNTLSVDMDTAVSRSSSIMSDRDPLSTQMKSESLTNLHGSLEDVRNIYLTHNETPALECHQGNVHLEDATDRDQDRSDASMDPWLKDIIAGSQDDVSYYKDVSDVIKNLDNILNSEKTSSSESSHQASPSRDNLSLDCKKEYPLQSSLVKSPGINNFQNILDTGSATKPEDGENLDDELDRDTIGTLSHSFERHSDSASQHTLENLTPDTPMKDLDVVLDIEGQVADTEVVIVDQIKDTKTHEIENKINETEEVAEVERRVETVVDDFADVEFETDIVGRDELPKEVADSNIPKLKELCVTSTPSVSECNNEQSLVKKDCQTPCDIVTDIRTDNEETKSIDDVREVIADSMPLQETEATEAEENHEQIETTSVQETFLPVSADEATTSNEGVDTLPSVTDDVSSTTLENDTSHIKLEDIGPESIESENNYSKDETILVSDLADTITDSSKNEQQKYQEVVKVDIEVDLKPVTPEQTPVSVQNIIDDMQEPANLKDTEKADSKIVKQGVEITPTHLPPEIVQNTDTAPVPETLNLVCKEIVEAKNEKVDNKDSEAENMPRSDSNVVVDIKERSDDSAVDMDLINNTISQILGDSIVGNSVNKVEIKEINSVLDTTPANDKGTLSGNESTVYLDLPDFAAIKNIDDFLHMERVISSQHAGEKLIASSVNEAEGKEINSDLDTTPAVDNSTLSGNESTVYLDLPTFEVNKKTDDFLHMERIISSQHDDVKLVTSTPITSDTSVDNLHNKVANSTEENETIIESETVVPANEPGKSITKLEQKCVPDSLSPFESPSHKSHHTDTYDENSSVVLGPFENCTMELFKAAKSSLDPVELPREELLAFSSNFSEMNLETPSPLRDGNFLNEVPDIIPDDMQFEDLASISEPKVDLEVPSDDTDESGSGTQKRVSPSTPPNSPGIFLASTSQQKCLVDIDLNTESAPEPDSSSLRSIELNQIELQITSKLAMAENENNLNIEYLGPLTVEGLIEEGGAMRESDAIPDSYLAGNGGSVEDVREELSLDEECVKALRNELELKLPLAQVAAIEPQCEGDGDWQGELPPPPELVFNYASGALSPIREETRQQLSAYENDTNWNTSYRTDSSESYPEPCNNSTDSVTELPCRDSAPPSVDRTITLHRTEPPSYNARDLTMSADSLNASPRTSYKEPDDILSPVNDRTYTKEDEREPHCERISQVSPFLVSPTTDTSDTGDNATRVSTLSKTTLPTDAKLSKPSDTQCLSKATSIDSWCSNDTLYNVEENFDDLAMDPDLPVDYEPAKREGNSDSTDTLTHNDDEKEHSHCSTYIIYESKSENCETFSPDSITAKDNNTYTKVKTEAAGTTPSGDTDLNDSSKNTHTSDLAYGTLMSGMPTFSNFTTDVASGHEGAWRLPQPELVRRSPVPVDTSLSPPKTTEGNDCLENSSPQLASEPRVRKMDSVEITFLRDDLNDNSNESETEKRDLIVVDDSPNYNYRDVVPPVTSIPLIDLTAKEENAEVIPLDLVIDDIPNYNYRNMASLVTSTPLAEQIADNENAETIPLNLPENLTETGLNCRVFQHSAELGPQDLWSNATDEAIPKQESEVLLEGYSKSPSQNSNRDSLIVSERTPTSSDFDNSVQCRPQNTGSSQSMESGISSEEFRQFENSARSRPQDMSSLINASPRLLKSERMPSELTTRSSTGLDDQTSQSNSKSNEPMQSIDANPPSITNLIESHELVDTREPSLINFDMEDETQQPHSIIITEIPMNANRISPNRTNNLHFDSNSIDIIQPHALFENNSKVSIERNLNTVHPKMNGENSSPQLASEPRVRKDSVEKSCLRNDFNDNSNRSETENRDLVDFDNSPNYNNRIVAPSVTNMPLIDTADEENAEAIPLDLVNDDSPNYNYKNMATLVTSTPLVVPTADEEDAETIPLYLPETSTESGLNFRVFQHSAEWSPQDLWANATDEAAPKQESEVLPEGKSPSQNSNRDGLTVSEPTPASSDFDNFVPQNSRDPASSDFDNSLPQNSRDRTSQSMLRGLSSEEFRQFENSLRSRPQDLSSLIDVSSRLLESERMSSELAMRSLTGLYDQTSQSNSKSMSNEVMQSRDASPPSITNLIESHELVDTREPSNTFVINFDMEDETEQPHSIIVTEIPMNSTTEHILTTEDAEEVKIRSNDISSVKLLSESQKNLPNGSTDLPKSETVLKIHKEVQLNGGSEKYATVNFLNETFEELIESSVDDSDIKDDKLVIDEQSPVQETTTEIASELEEKVASPVEDKSLEKFKDSLPRSSKDSEGQVTANGVTEAEIRMTAVTEDFLQNEKKYATSDPYFPLLSDIRFTGPASEMMSTSFQDSPTSPTSPECEQDSKPNTVAELLKEWDSDSDSHSSNSSSGEFIWKDGDGHETSVVPTTHFDHQRGSGGPVSGGSDGQPGPGSSRDSAGSGASGGSGDSGSGSGSEGDEVEFVPSSWDCRAAPAKSSLRSLEQVTPDSKKRVVFKRQKYHCVYEYPREASDAPHSPAYLPDLSTYCEWDPSSAEEAELCYGQLFSSPSALGAAYPLRSGIAFGPDYEEDFFISSSARPFESLGVMSSQFFPGMHKRALLEREPDDDPPPASPLPPALQPRTPSLDFTTPDSGVEDVTPGSTVDEDLKRDLTRELTWRAIDSGSSSESASPSSPGGEAPGSPGGGEAPGVGGLRHTRDKLKLDLPPSPRVPSPRHARVFSFVLDKPKRRAADPPLVMTDDTPLAPALPPADPTQYGAPPPPEPTFSTFGKGAPKSEPEQKLVLDELDDAPPEGVKGEGTLLDSGDEDSGIESSSKATLERKAPDVA